MEDDDLCPARDGGSVLTACGGGSTGAGLREEDLADGAVGAYLSGDAGENSFHAGVLGEQDTFAWEEELEEHDVEDGRAGEAGGRGEVVNRITVDPTVAANARLGLDRMLALP